MKTYFLVSFAVSLLSVSCVPTQSQMPIIAPTYVATQIAIAPQISLSTATPLPSATPTAYPVPPTAAPTEISFRNTDGTWGSILTGARQGMVDPQQMYALVGAVNRANRSVLPLGEISSVKVAVDTTGADLTTLDKTAYLNLKDVHLAKLKSSDQFRALWPQLLSSLKEANLAPDKTSVIWDPAAQNIKILGVQDGNNTRRFSIGENGVLREINDYDLLPELKTEGAFLKRADTGEVVEFKGVCLSLILNNSSFNAGNFDLTIRYINELKQKYGVNIVRLGLDAQGVLDVPIEKFDKIIDAAEKAGVYLVLNPEYNNGYVDQLEPLPSDNVSVAMAKLAARYSKRSHLLYGLWNEPHDTTWETWIPKAENIGKAIRVNNAKAILMVSGLVWSRDFRYFQNHKFALDNIVYNVHDYTDPNYSRGWWDFLYNQELGPVMIGEFGDNNLDPNKVDAITDTTNFVNSHPGIGYTAFGYYPYLDPNRQVRGLVDNDGNLTRAGSVILGNNGDLLKGPLPPTRFDN